MQSIGGQFRPKGKTGEEITGSIVHEAERIVAERDMLYQRNAEEIESSRVDNVNSVNDISDPSKFKRIMVRNMLELGEPDQFSYEFHMKRRDIIELIERPDDFDLGSTFVSIASTCGVRVLIRTIQNANLAIGTIYDAPADSRSVPQLCLYSFENLDIDVGILNLFIGYYKQLGLEEIFNLLASQYDK